MQAQVGGRVTVTAIRSLHDGESPWWINLRSPDDSPSAVVLRTPSRRVWPDRVATNAAALAVAEKYGLPAPRLLGTDLDGRDAGVPATLETVVASRSLWPAKGSSGLSERLAPRSPKSTASLSLRDRICRFGLDRSRSMTSPRNVDWDGC